jgi:hypothetical protein
MTEASKVIEYIRSLPKEKLQSLTYEDLLSAGIDVKKLPAKELVSIAKELRNLGLGYKRISKILDIPTSTIYRYFSKLELKTIKEKIAKIEETTTQPFVLTKLTKLYILLTLIIACKDALDLIDELSRDLGLQKLKT